MSVFNSEQDGRSCRLCEREEDELSVSDFIGFDFFGSWRG